MGKSFVATDPRANAMDVDLQHVAGLLLAVRLRTNEKARRLDARDAALRVTLN